MAVTEPGVPATMCEAFQHTVARHPGKVALRTPGGAVSITWEQYASQVRKIAAGLASLGVRRGDTVALMMTNRPEFYLADTAAFHLTRQWSARPLRMADPPSARSSHRCTRRA